MTSELRDGDFMLSSLAGDRILDTRDEHAARRVATGEVESGMGGVRLFERENGQWWPVRFNGMEEG